VVTIAMSDPTDLSAVDQLAFHTGKRIKPVLAGDSEIVQAIQQHYGGEEKPAVPAPAKPAPGAARPAAAPAPKATPPPSAPFPRRIDSEGMPTQHAGSPRVAPEQFEEIDAEEAQLAVPPPPPPPEPLEIPEDDSGSSDGQMMGLEPIAAHSQFGEQVSGAEELSGGEGAAADAVEGLEPAGVPHEGADGAPQMEGLEPIAAHSQEPTGWEEQPSASWDEAPAADAAAPPPSEEFAAAPDWSAQQPASPEASGEELPMDAIIGTAEHPATAPVRVEAASAEAEAPDAWASVEDPLGAQTTPEQPTQEFAEEATPPAEAAAEAAGESVTAEAEEPQQWTEAAAQPDQAIEEPAAPEEQPAAEEPQQWAEPTEQSAAETAPEIEQPAPEEPYYAEQAAEQPAEPEMPVEEVAEEYSDQQGELKLEGWVAPPSEPEPQGAGWLGEALESTTPLSPNDVGTLSAVGVDPNDGVAALRALAAILRVLNRRQMLDVDEIAAEIRESREQGAAAAAERAAQVTDGTPAEAPPGEEAPAQESAEPAET